MHSFDLHWPGSTAMLYTDGTHLKIVVRDKRGPSGNLTNIELCKNRVAFGLDFAPDLLTELRSHGYEDLAVDIEQRVEPETASDPVGDWLDTLDGDGVWTECGAKRSTKWRELCDGLSLKLPAKRGNPEWVLKDTRGDGKAAYLSADGFKGIVSALHERDPDVLATCMAACAELRAEHADIDAAVATWPTP